MNHPTLWNIHLPDTTEGSVAHVIIHPDYLHEGLSHHLYDQALTITLIQIQQSQRLYVALHGCEGCRLGRCEMGCRADILRRTFVAAAGDALRLRLIQQGLVIRPYTRSYLAWPVGTDAQPLTGELLHGWPEARLRLRWVPGKQPQVNAALALAGTGPDILARLRESGWKALRLRLPTRQLQAWVPRVDQVVQSMQVKPWRGAIWLPLPISAPAPAATATAPESGAVGAAGAGPNELAVNP